MSPLLSILSLPFAQPAPQLAGLGAPGCSTLRLLAGLPRLCEWCLLPADGDCEWDAGGKGARGKASHSHLRVGGVGAGPGQIPHCSHPALQPLALLVWVRRQTLL